MARRRIRRVATYADLPKRLQWRVGESRERRAQRYWWLESRGLSVVGYLGWRRSQDPHAASRPPSRRKLMRVEELAALDAQREREPPPW
jgi:hypothetical protein